MRTNKKFILVKIDKTISYNDENCFVNDIPLPKEENGNTPPETEIKDKAENLKKGFYNEFFKKHFKHIVVLTAAGTSLDNGDEETQGKTREGLWNFCEKEINAFESKIIGIKEKDFYKTKNIEELLSHIILFKKVNIIDSEKDEFQKLISNLEKEIAIACTLDLNESAPHKTFLNKITARKPSDSRVQLFTTNYDTLFEQAANDAGFVVIDGFSFTHPREFSGRYFDYDIVNREKTRIKQEDSFIKKVFHLHKLHGSLNWEKESNKIVQKDKPANPLIIYPASEKYESSYEQPYFEMMSRFQQALRKDNVLLIVIGFGFQDKHIQNVIIEAVEQNPSFQLVILNYNANETIEATNLESFFTDTEKMIVKRNVIIIFDKFSKFTENYPENQTYNEFKESNNETIQP